MLAKTLFSVGISVFGCEKFLSAEITQGGQEEANSWLVQVLVAEGLWWLPQLSYNCRCAFCLSFSVSGFFCCCSFCVSFCLCDCLTFFGCLLQRHPPRSFAVNCIQQWSTCLARLRQQLCQAGRTCLLFFLCAIFSSNSDFFCHVILLTVRLVLLASRRVCFLLDHFFFLLVGADRVQCIPDLVACGTRVARAPRILVWRFWCVPCPDFNFALLTQTIIFIFFQCRRGSTRAWSRDIYWRIKHHQHLVSGYFLMQNRCCMSVVLLLIVWTFVVFCFASKTWRSTGRNSPVVRVSFSLAIFSSSGGFFFVWLHTRTPDTCKYFGFRVPFFFSSYFEFNNRSCEECRQVTTFCSLLATSKLPKQRIHNAHTYGTHARRPCWSCKKVSSSFEREESSRGFEALETNADSSQHWGTVVAKRREWRAWLASPSGAF